MPVTLINAFIVPADQEEAFLERWREAAAVFRKHPGFIATHMHRNTGVGNPTFAFVNVAPWTSAEAWWSTHDEYQPRENLLPGVKGHPAIFEDIIDVAHGDDPVTALF